MSSVDILESLLADNKSIPSKYFYDDRGSELFARITELDEYYPTRCENEVLQNNAHTILERTGANEIVIVELGAGDGRKTKHLLHAAVARGMQVTYKPIDISKAALDFLEDRLREFQGKIRFDSQCLDLEQSSLPLTNTTQHLILFLGSSIGNWEPSGQVEFLNAIQRQMRARDQLLIGFDLNQEPEYLLPAYFDSKGITSAFNLNLLERLNREYAANFVPSQWRHKAVYSVEKGAMESYLVSMIDQVVRIGGRRVFFRRYEHVQTEISWKFSNDETRDLARASGFHVVGEWFCKSGWFQDSLWEKSEISVQQLS
jgi:L-histidine N-alpha-methyltransferase